MPAFSASSCWRWPADSEKCGSASRGGPSGRSYTASVYALVFVVGVRKGGDFVRNSLGPEGSGAVP